MTYEELKRTAPAGLHRKKKKREITPRSVILFFIVNMILFAIFGSMIQYALGMIGVAITEFFFLIVSVLYVRWSGNRMKDVFPIHKPKMSAVFGTMVMWVGAYFLVIVCNIFAILIMGDNYVASSDSETILSGGLPGIVLFVIVAMIPPICEEAFHRGVIQYGLGKKIRNPWVMALTIGLIFGIFHLDPTKFLATGILGAVMGWILVKTRNIVYTSLFHFIHNGIQMIMMLSVSSVLMLPKSAMLAVTGAAEAVSESDPAFSAMVAISYAVMIVLLGCSIPILLYTGNWLIVRCTGPRRCTFLPEEKTKRKKTLRMILIPTFAFLIIGGCIAGICVWAVSF